MYVLEDVVILNSLGGKKNILYKKISNLFC
jgi:hypothetical protein